MDGSLIAQVPCAICHWDEGGTLLWMSDWLETLTGWPADALREGRVQLRDCVLSADWATREAVQRESGETGQPYAVEYRIRRLDGSVCWVQERGQRERAGRGWITVLMEALTEQQEQAETLQRALVQMATHPALSSGDLAQLCAYLTEAATRLLQVDRASVWLLDESVTRLELLDLYSMSTGRHTRDVVLLAEQYPAYFSAMRSGRVIDAHEARQDARTCEFREGYLEPLGIHALLDAAIRVGGEVVGVVCLEDTGGPRRWLPLEMTFAGELAEQVSHVLQRQQQVQAQREHVLLQQKLLQAQRMEAIGRLAGGVAHDFNNLLTVIVNVVDLLALPPDCAPPGHAQSLGLLREAAERASRLVEQLLTFSLRRVRTPTSLDPRHTIRAMERLLIQMLGPGVTLHLALDKGVGCILFEQAQLEQVVTNLALNAREAMAGQGSLTICGADVSLPEAQPPTTHLPPGPYFRLEVEDTGPGIPPEIREHIFEPFFTTRSGRGSGLGLSTVYGLVTQASGEVLLLDRVPHGARFVVFLPLQSPAPTATHTDATVTPVPVTAAPLPGSPVRQVLLVEDEPAIRSIITQILREEGCEVTAVATVAEGQEAVATAPLPLDILFCDVILPDGRGHQLAEALRHRFPQARVVFLSGYVDDAERAGDGDAFLSKPFPLHQIRSLLRTLVPRPR